MESLIVYLSHLDSKILYPSNRPTAFTIEFDSAIRITNQTSVELLQLSFQKNTQKREDICVLSDICHDSVWKGGRAPILRKVGLPASKKGTKDFSNTFAVKTLGTSIKRCKIYIRTSDLEEPSFQFSDLRVTLRFNNVYHS